MHLHTVIFSMMLRRLRVKWVRIEARRYIENSEAKLLCFEAVEVEVERVGIAQTT